MVQQFETAQFLPIAVRPRLSGELVGDARRDPEGAAEDALPYSREIEQTVELAMLANLRTDAAARRRSRRTTAKWGFDQRSEPQERTKWTRIDGGEGVIHPRAGSCSRPPLVEASSTCCSSSRAPSARSCRLMMMGGVVGDPTSMFSRPVFLDDPYAQAVAKLGRDGSRAPRRTNRKRTFARERIIIRSTRSGRPKKPDRRTGPGDDTYARSSFVGNRARWAASGGSWPLMPVISFLPRARFRRGRSTAAPSDCP